MKAQQALAASGAGGNVAVLSAINGL